MVGMANRVLLIFVSILFSVSLASCGLDDGGIHITWSEEVLLPSGEQVVIGRTTTGATGGALGGPVEWLSSETTVRIPAMPKGAVPPAWIGSYIPVLLDYEDQQDRWTLLVTVLTCPQWYELGRPSAPYLQYESRKGAPWLLVPLDDEYFGKKSNVLGGPRQNDGGQLINWQEKLRRKLTSADNYRLIVESWNTSC